MGSGIYLTKIRQVNKAREKYVVELSTREVKKYIMEVNGWTSREYDKKYDIFKNKLRAYENYQRSHGMLTPRQSPMQLLYKQARARERDGANYKPSIKMQRINSFTSVSSGKAGQRALRGKKYQDRRSRLYEQATNLQFEGLLKANPKAREIAEAIKDPVRREQALADFANAIRAKVDEEDRVTAEEAIPFSGEVSGSDSVIDFAIEDYLE